MLKLHQHFVRNYIFVFLFALICASFVSYVTLKNVYIHKLENDIEATIKVIKLQMPFSKNSENLKVFAKALKKNTGHRFSFIKESGEVISDSDFDAQKMENHRFRPEIQAANESEFGKDLRYSKTAKEDFLYVANSFILHGKPIFIRVAVSTKYIQENFLHIWSRVVMVLIGVFMVSFIISYFINLNIQKEIRKLINGLQDIANKEYKTKIKASFAKEFVDISSIVYDLSQKLLKREKQKRKHGAKLKFINKQRSQTISAISHEFKNPIASIMGYTQTLLEDGDENPQIRKRFLGKIVSNSQKITDMIDRLSLATKLENNDLVPIFSTFDLSELANEVVENFKTRYPKRVFKTTFTSFIVKADSAMIEMVLNNLLDNAVKYSQSSIHVKVGEDGCFVVDKGEGIPQKEIGDITKKFYRSNRLSWDNSMGLGLSLVDYMLKLHDTKLHILSKIGEGSTFSFKLKP